MGKPYCALPVRPPHETCGRCAYDSRRYCSFLYFGGIFNKTIIPLTLVRYEMFIGNEAHSAKLAIYMYHLISHACSWNNNC